MSKNTGSPQKPNGSLQQEVEAQTTYIPGDLMEQWPKMVVIKPISVPVKALMQLTTFSSQHP
jgi:hypothetical protein